MPRLRCAEIRHFTLDPQVWKFLVEQIAYAQIQLAHAPNVFFGNQIQRKLRHSSPSRIARPVFICGVTQQPKELKLRPRSKQCTWQLENKMCRDARGRKCLPASGQCAEAILDRRAESRQRPRSANRKSAAIFLIRARVPSGILAFILPDNRDCESDALKFIWQLLPNSAELFGIQS